MSVKLVKNTMFSNWWDNPYKCKEHKGK